MPVVESRRPNPTRHMHRNQTTARALLALLLLPPASKMMAQAASNQPAPDEEVVVLSPFSVTSADERDGYQVKDTLAGTRVRTDLKDIASSISVINSVFLRDTGARNNQDLLLYTMNTEVGGIRGNFSGVGNTFVQGVSETNALLRPNQNTRVRGLDSADNTRDFFITDIPWDGYIVDRVDLQRGPNSILFGLGSPAGIVNSSINGASFKTSGKMENRFSNFGSVRTSADYNYVVLKNELAFRVAALDDSTYYRQRPAYQRDQRVFGAVKFVPKELRTETARTEIEVKYEAGDIQANRPRMLPPMDKLTPWFMTGVDSTGKNNLNKLTMDPYYAWAYGALTEGPAWRGVATDYSHWISPYMMNGMQLTANPVVTYTRNSPVPTGTPNQANPNAYWAMGVFDKLGDTKFSTGAVTGTADDVLYRDAGIGGFPFARQIGIAGMYLYSQHAGLPGNLTGAWKDKTLSDPSIFNFFDNLIDGDTKHEFQKWNTYNVSVKQMLFKDRVGLNATFDHQDYRDGYSRLFGQNQETPAISIDINSYLMDYPAMVGAAVIPQTGHNAYPSADTAPAGYTGPLSVKNPNAGRAFVAGSYGSGTNASYHSKRDAWRLQGSGEFRAEDVMGNTPLAKILGRHIITGLYSHEKVLTENRSWATAALSMKYANDLGVGGRLSDGGRIPDWIVYLSDNLNGKTSASGLNLQGISAVQQPAGDTSIRYYDSHWDTSKNSITAIGKDYWANPAIPSWDGTKDTFQTENPANYVGWKTGTYSILNANKGDTDQLYMDGSKIQRQIDSQAAVYQGYFWDDTIVPTVGWRKDTLSQRSGNAPINDTTGAVSMDYGYGSTTTKTRGESLSYGGVIHTPKFIVKKMPLNTSIDLFANSSENTRVETRYGFRGESLPNTEGKTTEYGVAINTLRDKLQFKLTWYKTKVKNASIAAGETGTLGANTYYIYLLESWSLGRALQDMVGLAGGPLASGWSPWAAPDSGYATGSWDRAGMLAHPSTAVNIKAIQATLANQLPQSTYDAYGFQIDRAKLASYNAASIINGSTNVSSVYTTTNAGTPDESTVINGLNGWVYNKQGVGDIQALGKGRINGTYPMGTIDNESRGLEFEMTAQPIRNWNITVNVAKTRATRTEIGKELVDVLNEDYVKWVGPNPTDYKKDLYNADGSSKLTTWYDNKLGKASMNVNWGGQTYSVGSTGNFINEADNKSPAGDIRLWWAGDNTIRQYFLNNLWYPYQFQLQASRLRADAPELNPWRVNIITNLSFDNRLLPILKGVNIGGAVRWQQGNILGYELDSEGIALDPSKPLRGPGETNVDLWIGYGHKLTKTIDWRIQLNLRDVGKKARLLPLSMNPDKTVATWRIADGTSFQLTNTFSF